MKLPAVVLHMPLELIMMTLCRHSQPDGTHSITLHTRKGLLFLWCRCLHFEGKQGPIIH